jgi:hypothetical protein
MVKVIEMQGGWKSAADFNLQANRTPLYPPRVRRILSCRPVQCRATTINVAGRRESVHLPTLQVLGFRGGTSGDMVLRTSGRFHLDLFGS